MRSGPRRAARDAWAALARDADPRLRRRAAELAPGVAPVRAALLHQLLTDAEPLVAETAAWAAGEIAWPDARRPAVVELLAELCAHRDALVRESATAALGAIGDPAGLPAILTACRDRPAVRRRAVLALAPFTGPEVDAALAAALEDPDWQTRQAAEDLTRAGDA